MAKYAKCEQTIEGMTLGDKIEEDKVKFKLLKQRRRANSKSCTKYKPVEADNSNKSRPFNVGGSQIFGESEEF